jgi:Kae1-associated kinase Bud32
MADDELIFLGAEAEVRRATFLGRATVRKRRLVKAYRHPDLDARIRRERTRAEAALLAEASAAGVRVPRVLDVDLDEAALQLEFVNGLTLRDALEKGTGDAAVFCRGFGEAVGRLHTAGLVHGDLTTSNVLLDGEGLVLVDFGLAQRSQDVEDQGVDLHLVERTFESTPPDRSEYWRLFAQGYREAYPGAETALRRMDEIKARGRYV